MKVCICGTIKNVGKFLPAVFENMEKIASIFDEYVILLYYDHSYDNTLEEVKKFQARNSKVLFYVNNAQLSPYRTHNIAKGRNYCLKIIKLYYSDYEYMIMMDCDEVSCTNININILKTYLLCNENWDALSFNRKDYYDIWALSIPPYVVSMRHFQNMSNVEDKMKKYIKNMLDNTPKNKLVKCLSAFNGFSIYKTALFINCFYDGRLRLDLIPKNRIKINEIILKDKIKFIHKNIGAENTLYEDCEHRSFHLQAVNKYNARICISPYFLYD